jgi:predicted naringenin-chalcone synthase
MPSIAPFILSLSTAVPAHSKTQAELSNHLSDILHLQDKKKHQLEKIFLNSKIAKRHSVIKDFHTEAFMQGLHEQFTLKNSPGTAARNEIYIKEAPKLAKKAAEKALQSWGGDLSTISHIISVSCTGMYAPGLEFLLMSALKLSPYTQRFGLNFMGCFGAFRALALAKSLALENPDHRILIVCTELCSLHFQLTDDVETFVVNSLFADGAAAAVIGGHLKKEEQALFSLEKTASFGCPDTEKEMDWKVTDTGNQMRLTKDVPRIIKDSIVNFAKTLLPEENTFADCLFAAHPGGKGILQSILKAFDLEENDLSASFKTLKEYGNMSSASFLFVLKAILESTNLSKKLCLGLGMGPGLSFEGILLKQCHAT